MPDPDSRITILVADDNSLNRELLKEYLDALGYQPRLVGDGRAALDALAGELPEAILLDIDMPELDGFEVLAAVSADERLRDIPVIMISGRDDIPSIVRCLEMGAADFLPKPFNPRILQARLSASLDKKRLRDRERDLIRMQEALTHMIVHDLGNPLSVIQMNAEMMAMLGTGDNEQLTHITRAAASMGTMIESMLDLTKLESGTMPVRPERVDLARLLSRFDAEYQPFADDRGLRLEFDGQAPHVYADPLLLQRMLANLVGNALKYARPATFIRVSTERHDTVTRIAVSDDGPGIPEAHRERVFDRFYQVEAKEAGVRAGIGLGLSFCRLAAEAQNGTIHVDTTEGGGTTFILELPAAQGDR
ncbi:MAG: hybrid sensor histidine kinase/response regulator [Rhodothermales bacterium]